MPEDARARIKALEREVSELRRRRPWFEYNPDWSSVARKEAVERIDRDIAAKQVELGQLKKA